MKTCTHCGAPMTSDSPEGLCARCLLSVAVKDDADAAADSEATQPALASGSRPAVAIIDIADASEVAKRLPQFEIMELLGRGGMGVVYKARQILLDRIVALKILPPGDANSPGFIERFRREARSLAKLSHPNIVHLYEFGETGGLYFFVMEYVDGVNLRQMILAHHLSAAEALSVVPKICDALQFAHEEGVVHRDIKPENILIDKKGRVKIADFGLAKLLGREEIDPRLTVSGATLGTPRYMAPEQMDKPETVDHRADIYSLGVVFYEMLTGELPMGRFAPPSQKVQIDVRLDEIVLHALERDVELRYQHASQVRDDVERVTSSKAAPDQLAAKFDAPPPFVDYAPVPATGRLRSRLTAFFVRDPDRWWVIGASVAVFFSSLFLPAAYFYKDSPRAMGWPPMNGAEAFQRAFENGIVIWLANPALWGGWILLCFRRRWLAFAAGMVAFVLAIWLLNDRNVIDNYMTINGEKTPMGALRLQAGYACWLGSTAIFAMGALFLAIRGRRQEPNRQAAPLTTVLNTQTPRRIPSPTDSGPMKPAKSAAAPRYPAADDVEPVAAKPAIAMQAPTAGSFSMARFMSYFSLATLIFAVAFFAALALWNFRWPGVVLGGVLFSFGIYFAVAIGRRLYPFISGKWNKDSWLTRNVRLVISLAFCILGYYLTIGGTFDDFQRTHWRTLYREKADFEAAYKGKEYQLVRLLPAYTKSVPQVEMGFESFHYSPAKYFFGNSEPQYDLFAPSSSDFLLYAGFALLIYAAFPLIFNIQRAPYFRPNWRRIVPPLVALSLAIPAGWVIFHVTEILLEESNSLPYSSGQGSTRLVKASLDDVRTKLESALQADGYVKGEMNLWTMSTVPEGKMIGRAGFMQEWKPSPFDRWHWQRGILTAASPQIFVQFVSAEKPHETVWTNGQWHDVIDPTLETWVFVDLSMANRKNINYAEVTAFMDHILAAAQSAESKPSTQPH